MAKPKASKQREQEPAKTRLYLTVDTALLKRYKHTAVDLGLSESDLFELFASMHCGSVHARGVSDELRAAAAGQGSGAPIDQAAPVVRIPNVTNRLNDIARRAHGPIDDALDGLANESA